MAADLIFVEADEEIPTVIERIRQAAQEEVQLVLPLRSRFAQSRFNFQLLKQYATRLGKPVSIVAPDAAVKRMAEESGFPARLAVGAPAQPPPRLPPRPPTPPTPGFAPLPPAPIAAVAAAAAQPIASRLAGVARMARQAPSPI